MTLENNKRIVKNTIFLYFRMLLVMAVSLYTSRVVLNALGITDFGIYNVVGGVVTLFSFLNSSMAGSTSRFLTIELGKGNFEQFKRVFNVTIINHILLGLLVVLLAETIGLWFVQNKLIMPSDRRLIAFWVYQLSVLTTFISIIQIPFSATIISHEKMSVYAYCGLIESFLKLLIAILITVVQIDKLIFFASATCGITIIINLVYLIYVIKKFSYCRFQIQKDKYLYKVTLSYSGWDLLGNFSVVAQGQGLNILLNMFFGPAVNAARGIAYQVQGALTQFDGNLMLASRPQIIKYYAQNEKEKMMDLVFNTAKYSFFLLWLLSLPILIETKYILELWLKIVPEHTIMFTRLVIIISLITTFRNPFFAVMHATGKIKIPNIIVGTLLISVLPISYIFLKNNYQAEIVFIITLVIISISMWIEWYLVKRVVFFSILDAFHKILFPSILTIILSSILPVIIYNYLNYGFIRFCIILIISLLAVIISILGIGINKHERLLIKNRIIQFFIANTSRKKT